ncbi:MAG: sigma 54-interacting transcriptional regulator, partial [Acidobacteriales bacterium]|nr:sigma 54-interacting transcriptional regulator [Terriglobales bacterium]
VKLLRVLEARTFFRVGGVKQVKVDFRLVAATNKNLLEEVRENRFRQDLLYRINTVTVEIPPLRERVDDIALLVEHFTKKTGLQDPVTVSSEAMELLRLYSWPGNVRELKNVMERAMVLASKGGITANCLPAEVCNGEKRIRAVAKPAASGTASLADLEREQILATLDKVNWHRGRAAGLLGITPKTLYRKLRSYNIGKN